MDLLTPEDDQDVQVISDKSDYWQRWEEEVRYNSGQTHARDITPRHLMETINEEPGEPEVIKQQTDLEYEDEGRLIIAEPGGEYIEEQCDDPLSDKKDTKINCHDAPLDLTTRIEAGRQSRQSVEATVDTHSQPMLKTIHTYRLRLSWRRR